jgi:hypothetical protein
METLKYTDEELDAMSTAAEEEELISRGYFKENGFWKKPKDKVKKWVLSVEADGPSADSLLDKLENRKPGSSGDFGMFFNE